MPLVRALLAVLAALALAVPATALPATALPTTTGIGTPSPAEEATPLRVHLDEMTPVVPGRGRLTYAGTVTNDSLETWTDINVLAFRSGAPILDGVGLATSAIIPEEAYVGERVTTPGTYSVIPSLAPGESASFRLRVPVTELALTEPGVYWTGVHARGESPSQPRDDFTDGRARTFVPVVPPTRTRAEVAVVVPLRASVSYDAEGRLSSLARWKRQLSEGGRLDRVLDIGDAAGSTEFTWLVDPAVLDAVSRLAAGNPARSLDPDPTVPGQEPTQTPPPQTDEEGDGEATPRDATSTPGVVPEGERSEEEQELAALATAWLARVGPMLVEHQVLALPYGDLDVSATARRAPELLDLARARGEQTLVELGVPATPAAAPEDGVLSPDGLAALPAATTVLLADTAFTPPPTSPTSVVRVLEHQVVVTSSGAQSGGPAPTVADDPLAMRQRVLSEAALGLVNGSRAPLVVTLPTRWQPDNADIFFDALEQPWLRPVELASVEQGVATEVSAAGLAYTDEDASKEVGAAAFDGARSLIDVASLTERLLTLATTIERQVHDEALASLSVQHRRSPRAALGAVDRAIEKMRDDLDLVEVEGPRAVTLTSDSGPLGLTLVNGLDQPVSVDLVVTSDGPLRVTGQGPRELAPRSRTQVRLVAAIDRTGIHEVTARLTTVDGEPVGRSMSLPIRASQVSELIWWIMGGGAAILFGAIAVRLWRRVRRSRAATDEHEGEHSDEHGEPAEDPQADAGEPR